MRNSSWDDGEHVYPYPFNGTPYGLPPSRRGRHGALDAGTQALASKGRLINMRRYIASLDRNPEEDHRRRWPLVDSLGRPLALIEQHDDRWELLDPVTRSSIYVDHVLNPRKLLVQGRGAMASDDLEESHALLAFNAGDRSTIPQGASIVPYRVRAFIDRRALPGHNSAWQRIRGAIDRYAAGEGDAEPGSAEPQTQPLADPGFDSNADKFVGHDGRARTYATYNAKPPYGGAMYLLINTPGVLGGGIVRGVVRAGDGFEPLDEFGYPDPNVRLGARPVATWLYGRVSGTRLAGWVPVHT
jgi:hypothetical protein